MGVCTVVRSCPALLRVGCGLLSVLAWAVLAWAWLPLARVGVDALYGSLSFFSLCFVLFQTTSRRADPRKGAKNTVVLLANVDLRYHHPYSQPVLPWTGMSM